MAGILTVDGDTAAADARALLVRSEGHRAARVVYTARVLLLLPSGAADSHAQAGRAATLIKPVGTEDLDELTSCSAE